MNTGTTSFTLRHEERFRPYWKAEQLLRANGVTKVFAEEPREGRFVLHVLNEHAEKARTILQNQGVKILN